MLAPAIIAAIITALVSGAVAIGSGIASHSATKNTNEINQQMYEDWKDYNNPTNQMQRFTDAGLNKYMVAGGVTNTLSSPFQVGNNQGIAQALQGLAGSVLHGGSGIVNAQIQKDAQALQEEKIANQREQLRLNSLGLQIKEKLANMNLKIGDYRSALLSTQGKIASNHLSYLTDTYWDRVDSVLLDSLLKEQEWKYGQSMNPLKLRFYTPYQMSMINNLNTRSSHLGWQEDFALKQWMMDNWQWNQSFGLNKAATLENLDIANRRLGLSNRYFDLAKDKFHWNMLMDGLNFGSQFIGKKPMLMRKTQKTAGGYPTIFDYEYGY